MNKPIHTKTFKSGNSIAVRLHRDFGLPADAEVTEEALGDGVWIRPVAKRPSLAEMSARLLKMGPIGEIERRVVDLPERRGL